MESGFLHVEIEIRQVDDRPPTSCGFGYHKHAAVIPWIWICRLHCPLLQQSLNLQIQGMSPDGCRGIRLVSDGSLRQRRKGHERNHVTMSQDFHHPRVHLPLPPRCPVEREAAAYRARVRLLSAKTLPPPTTSTAWRLRRRIGLCRLPLKRTPIRKLTSTSASGRLRLTVL